MQRREKQTVVADCPKRVKGCAQININLELELAGDNALERIKKILIGKVLDSCGGNVTQTSEVLGVSIRALRYWLKKYPELREKASAWSREIYKYCQEHP